MLYYMKKRFNNLEKAFEELEECSYGLGSSLIDDMSGKDFDEVEKKLAKFKEEADEATCSTGMHEGWSTWNKGVIEDLGLSVDDGKGNLPKCFYYITTSGMNAVEIAQIYEISKEKPYEEKVYYEVVFSGESKKPKEYSNLVESFEEKDWKFAKRPYLDYQRRLSKEEEKKLKEEYDRNQLENRNTILFDIEFYVRYYDTPTGAYYIGTEIYRNDFKEAKKLLVELQKNHPEAPKIFLEEIEEKIERIKNMQVPSAENAYVERVYLFDEKKEKVLKSLEKLKQYTLMKYFSNEEKNTSRIGYNFMIGVLPGNEHENEELTPEKALKIGDMSVKHHFTKDQRQNCSYKLASAVYSKNLGCPVGGKLGLVVKGSCRNKIEANELIFAVKEMMEELRQSTVTIELEQGGKLAGSIYISEGGEKVEYNKCSEKEVEHFKAQIPANKVDFTKIGSNLQDSLEEVSRENLYMTSGVLTGQVDKNGMKYYEYSGTQNPAYGQVDSAAYRMAAIETVKRATKGIDNVRVKFNDTNVRIGANLESIQR